MKKQLIFLLLITFSWCSFSQESSWFYLRAKDTLVAPKFEKINDQLKYIGKDEKLKIVFNKYIIYEFKKTFRNAKKEGLKKTNSILTISILEPIENGLDKETFLKKLENNIYSELDILN